MPSESATLAPGRVRRLHPASLGFSLISLGRQFLVPIVLFVVFARGDAWQRWLVVPFAIAVGVELVRYFTLTYRLTGHELVIRSGLLARTERHIPYERIQNVELVENAVHRLMGVAEVRLQTGGGAEVEAHLRVISRAAVEELRAALASSGRERDANAAEGRPHVLLRLPLAEVALHGLLTGRAIVLLAAIAGVVVDYSMDWDDFGEWLSRRVIDDETQAKVAEALGRGRDAAGGGAPLSSVLGMGRSLPSMLLWAAAFVPILVGLRVLAAAWTVVRLYDFTLERTGGGLQSRYGLLTRMSATIPRARVQVLSVQEGVLHRWLRRAAVRVETAGRFREEAGQLGSQWVAPIVRLDALATLVREVQPDAVIDPDEWIPVHPRAFTRMVRLQAIAIAIVALAAGIRLGPLVLAPAAIGAALAAWHARRLSRRLAIALTPTSVVLRTGAFGHRRSTARFERVQSVAYTRSPFDRRWGMARITVDTAGGAAEHRIEIGYLDEGAAREVYRRLRDEVARAVRA